MRFARNSPLVIATNLNSIEIEIEKFRFHMVDAT